MLDSYKVLEFPRILESIESNCKTEIAKNKVRHLEIYENLADLHEELDRLEEAMTIHRIMGILPLAPLADVSDYLAKAKMDGTLAPEELMAIDHMLENIFQVTNYFNAYEGEIKLLRDYVEGLEGDNGLHIEINRCIMPDGSISDTASETLFRIRKSMHALEGHIRHSMEGYLKSEKNSLSMDTLSSKNDRLVLAVKAPHKNDIKGLVHATSASGQTFFIEPESVVRMNNELNELRSQEQAEITKILHNLTRRVKHNYTRFYFDQELMSELDFIFAKARFGCDYDCVKPDVNEQGVLELKQARHPLIDQRKIIPNDIIIDGKMLMITGSNTGGKTVALKTAGLLSIMAISGLAVPAISASIPFFDAVYTDIGDEQSIEQSLSTYSSHMKKTIFILNNATCRSLILIDEIGSGTDPQEGACLGEAILDTLLKRDCRIIASTHYGELKQYGQTRDDITLASVGFDVETMRPTYRLKLHSVGSSYAFEIASSLGLDDEIIDHALHNKEERMSEAEKLTEKLTKQNIEMDEKEAKINQLLAENEKLHNRYEHQLSIATKQKEAIVEKAQEEANKMLEEAKKTIDELTKDIMQQGTLKPHQVIAAKHALDEQKFEKKEKIKVQEHVFKKGDHVQLDKMNREGDVIEVKKHELLVDIGGLQARVKDNEVTFMHGPSAPKKLKKAATRQHMKKTGHYEVNVIGMRYEEAMNIVEKFLDDALLLGYPSVRIVHGMGKGILRNGIRKKLDHLSFVKEYRDGGPNEGGLGVTVVSFE